MWDLFTAVNQQTPTIAYGVDGRTQLAWQDDSTGPWDLFTAVLDRSYTAYTTMITGTAVLPHHLIMV